MLGMFAANIFDSEIVKDKGKRDRTGVVFPEAVCVTNGAVTMCGKIFLE